MRNFRYVIYWKEGGSVSGVLSGHSKEEVEAYLRSRNAHREIKSIAISEM
jgi:type II secretory pathway component PulF